MPVQLDKGRSTILQFNVTSEIITRCSAWQIYSSIFSVRVQNEPGANQSLLKCVSPTCSKHLTRSWCQPSSQVRQVHQNASLNAKASPVDRPVIDATWSTEDVELSFPNVLREWWDLEVFPWCSADLNSPNPLHLLRIYSKNIQDCTVKIYKIVPLVGGNKLASKEHQMVSTGVRRWRFQPLKLQHRAALALWRCFTERRKKSLVSLGNLTMESSNRHHVMGTFNHCFQVIELSHPNISWKLFPLFGATHTNASRKRWRNLEGIEKSEGSKHSLEQV